MATFLFSFIIIALAGVGLFVGVLAGRGPVKGSCGGISCGKLGACAGCTRSKDQ